MKNNNILQVTILVSTMLLSPLAAIQTNPTQKVQFIKVSSRISTLLKDKGLEDEVADSLASGFIGEDEVAFLEQLNTLVKHSSSLTMDEVLKHCANLALYKRSMDLSSYASLVAMAQDITSKKLSENTLDELHRISMINSL